MEVSPGIHRIETDLGPRSMAQFLLQGEERSMLVDTGLATTPEASILPFIESVASGGSGPDIVLISHADVDHCGGNSVIRQAYPRAFFAAHGLDREWIERTAAMMEGNYLWYREFGFGPDDATVAWIEQHLGGDVELDIVLSGGEIFRIGDRLELEYCICRVTPPATSACGTLRPEPRSSSMPSSNAVCAIARVSC